MRAVRFLAGLALALGLATSAGATILYNSNNPSTGFDATTAGALPSGWASIVGTWQALTGAPHVTSHSKAFGDSSQTNNSEAVYTGISAVSDMEVAATTTLTLTSGASSTTGLGVRYNSAGTTGYICLAESGAGTVHLQWFKQTAAGTFSPIGSNVTAYTPPSSPDNMQMRVAVIGSNLYCKAWSATTAEPTSWSVTTSDSSYTSGYALVFNAQTNTGQQVGLTDLTINDTPQGVTVAMALITPAPITAGGTVSGTYTGTAPTGLNIAFDGSTTYSAVSSPTIGGGNFSFALPAITTAYHQMQVQNAGLTTETAATPAFSGTAGSTSAIAPNNAAIVYSPYNWTPPTSSVASTINAGAYFKTMFTGASLVLNFTVTNDSAPLSQIYYRIDGYEAGSPWIEAPVASTITVALPSNIAAGNGNLYHLLEVMVKSTSQTINRWNIPSNTAVNFAGLTLAAGASVQAPATYQKNCLFYGDSRMEGVRTVNQTAANDTDQNDALVAWPWQAGERLGCEFGVVGFGGQGVTIAGTGNVPALPSSYNLIMAGVSRTFSPNPDLIAIMDVGNDYNNSVAGSSVQSAMTTVLNALLSATSSTTKIAVLQDFIAAAYPTNLQAAVTATGSARVSYVSTAGVFNTAYGADSANQHPTAANDVALIAPQIASAMNLILYPTTSNGSSSAAANIGGRGLNVP
jgi:hypothetical protein